jgi:hypothetical protein
MNNKPRPGIQLITIYRGGWKGKVHRLSLETSSSTVLVLEQSLPHLSKANTTYHPPSEMLA